MISEAEAQELMVIGDNYRAEGRHENSLAISKEIIEKCPDEIKGYVRATQDYIALGRPTEALLLIEEALAIDANSFWVLITAVDLCRATSNREKSLEYSQLLAASHPGIWDGYGRAVEDLIFLQREPEALEKIHEGLSHLPDNRMLLAIASETNRRLANYSDSLKYALQLIRFHPDDYRGYSGAAQDFLAFGHPGLAFQKLALGLRNASDKCSLTDAARKLAFSLGNLDKSLEFSDGLILSQPQKIDGYIHAAQDLSALSRYKEAKERIKTALAIEPTNFWALIIATDVHRSSKDYKGSHAYATSLIEHHGLCWDGYDRSAKDLISLGKTEEARAVIEKGLNALPENLLMLASASETYSLLGENKTSLLYAERLINLYPDCYTGYSLAGIANASCGDAESAHLCFIEAIKRSEDKPATCRMCIEEFRRLGDRQKSLVYAQELIKVMPERLEGYIAACEDIAELKEPELAQRITAILDRALKLDDSQIKLDPASSHAIITEFFRNWSVSRLFEPSKACFYTYVAGWSNAKFVPCTQLHRHVYSKFFALLNRLSVNYYVFAGALVGFVRNGSFPEWMDDMDIMIFEEDIVDFERRVVPLIESCGFTVWKPSPPPRHGWVANICFCLRA
jgi:tetratricopeptide (TPR) repeat protein